MLKKEGVIGRGVSGGVGCGRDRPVRVRVCGNVIGR